LKIMQLVQGPLSAAGLFGRGRRRRGRGVERRGWRWFEPDTADVQIFLEAVELEEVGKLERPHIAAGLTDFLLEVSDDLSEVTEGEAGSAKLKPKPFPVKTQPEVLTGEAAIGLMQLLDLSGPR